MQTKEPGHEINKRRKQIHMTTSQWRIQLQRPPHQPASNACDCQKAGLGPVGHLLTIHGLAASVTAANTDELGIYRAVTDEIIAPEFGEFFLVFAVFQESFSVAVAL